MPGSSEETQKKKLENDPAPIRTYARGCIGDDDSPEALDFHDYCQMLWEESNFYRSEANEHRTLHAPPPLMRTLLRFWPAVMWGVTLFVYLLVPLLFPVNGPWAYVVDLPAITVLPPGAAVVAIATALIAYSILRAPLGTSSNNVVKPIAVYGIVGVLTVGTMASIVLVWQSDQPATLDDNVIFVSGYLLLWTLGGIFGYDLIIRGESMFDNFHYKNIIEGKDKELYKKQFHGKLVDALNVTVPVHERVVEPLVGGRLNDSSSVTGGEEDGGSERTSPAEQKTDSPWYDVQVCWIFGAAVVSYFGTFWYYTDGPQYLNSAPILGVNVFLNLLLLTGVFQFLIVSKYFYLLFEEEIRAPREDNDTETANGQETENSSAVQVPDGGPHDEGARTQAVGNPDAALGGQMNASSGESNKDQDADVDVDDEQSSTETSDGDADERRIELKYKPSHPDGSAGFRDFGDAAMRINLLIVIGGMYLVYRLFVNGNRAIPPGGIGSLGEMELLIWSANFLIPIGMYAIVVGFWLYAAFWRVHTKLRRKKEKLIFEQQKNQRGDDSSEEGMERPYGDAGDYEPYEMYQGAPVWPIDRSQFQTLFVTNLLPAVALLLDFL